MFCTHSHPLLQMFGPRQPSTLKLPSGVRVKSIFGSLADLKLESVHRPVDAKTAADILWSLREHKRVLVTVSQVTPIASKLTKAFSAAIEDLEGGELYISFNAFDQKEAIFVCGPFETESWIRFSARACSLYRPDAFIEYECGDVSMYQLLRMSETYTDTSTHTEESIKAAVIRRHITPGCHQTAYFNWANDMSSDIEEPDDAPAAKPKPKPKPKHRFKPYSARKKKLTAL